MEINDQDTFMYVYNEQSGRTATLYEEPFVAYLYLSKPHTPEFLYGTIAYMLIEPPNEEDIEASLTFAQPVLLSKKYCSDIAVLRAPERSDFDFQWSQDGESVALLYNNTPIVMASGHDDKGYSKAVARVFAYAHPWDQDVYDARFSA